MSKLTRCVKAPKPAPPFSARRALGILAIAGGCTAFGVGQLSLKFAVNDLEQETTRLQHRKMALLSQISLLRGEVESAKRGDHLLEHAREMGMIEYAPASWERVVVAQDIRERYAGVELAAASARRRSTAPRVEKRPRWAENLTSRMGLVGDALAGQIKPENADPNKAPAEGVNQGNR